MYDKKFDNPKVQLAYNNYRAILNGEPIEKKTVKKAPEDHNKIFDGGLL